MAASAQGWRTIQLDEILDFKNGLNKEKRFFGRGTPIVNFMDVLNHTTLVSENISGRVTLTRDEIKRFSARQGDVFFTRTSESVEEIGTASVLIDAIPNAVFSGFVLRGRSRTNELDPVFLAYALKAARVREQIISTATYTTRALTNGGSLGRVRVIVPPMSEQRLIVRALNDIDAMIDALRRTITKKQAIKQGLLQRLFRSVQGGAASDHAMRSGRLVEFLRQPATYGIVKAGEFQRTGVPMVRGGDIRDGRISPDLPRVTRKKSGEYARTVLQQGDVAVALVGYPGESAVVPDRLVGANISRAVGLLRPAQDLLPGFLAHYLNSPLGRKEFLKPSAGSAQIVVNLVDLNRMEIRVPSTDVQSAVAATLNDVDAEIATLHARLDKAVALKTGMMQELLTGRTRLPVVEAA